MHNETSCASFRKTVLRTSPTTRQIYSLWKEERPPSSCPTWCPARRATSCSASPPAARTSCSSRAWRRSRERKARSSLPATGRRSCTSSPKPRPTFFSSPARPWRESKHSPDGRTESARNNRRQPNANRLLRIRGDEPVLQAKGAGRAGN